MMLEVPKLRELCQGERKWKQPKSECFAVSESGRAKSSKPLTSDMRLQDLKCALPGFGLALAPPRALFFPFGMVMYIMCKSVLDVYDLLFDYTGGSN